MERKKDNEEKVLELSEEIDELYYLLALHGVSLRRDLEEADESCEKNDYVEKGSWSGVPLDLGAKSKRCGSP